MCRVQYRPAVSDDQERVGLFKPDVLVLVVYLANDLFDNERQAPTQVIMPNPIFTCIPMVVWSCSTLLCPPNPGLLRHARISLTNLAGRPQPHRQQHFNAGWVVLRSRVGWHVSAGISGVMMQILRRDSVTRSRFSGPCGRISESARELQAELTVALLPGHRL